MFLARSQETQQSMLSIGVGKAGAPSQSAKEAQAFSTENESAFFAFNPQLKQTGVFINRFFNKASYKDLAVKYDTTVSTARKTYHNTLKRLADVLTAMDNGNVPTKQVDFWKKKVAERSGNLPKSQKWFLMNKLFGLRPCEIAEMEGMDKNKSSVRKLIIRVSDQLKAGEISLIEVTPEEAAQTKARLDAHRQKQRRNHIKKKLDK